MMRSVLFLLAFAYAVSAMSTIWNVGTGKTYVKPGDIRLLVKDGDTVLIDGGVYLNDAVKWPKKNLVFKGLGTGNNRTVLKYNGDIPNGKGIWVFESPGLCDNPYIENIVFDGAQVSDANGANGAGIRFQAVNITVRNCLFMNCQNGILEGGSYSGSNVIIENSEFYNNGYQTTGSYAGYEHHMYISAQADTFLLRNCYIHDPRGEGNSVKTRALRNYILYNLIDENNGKGSYEIDIAQGGLNVIMGNTIVQGPNSVNHSMIAYEAVTNPINDFYFINNTVINKYPGANKYFNVIPSSGIAAFKVYNNVFASVPAATDTWLTGNVPASLDSSHNLTADNYNLLGFEDPSAADYSLSVSATALINKGTAAGSASTGYSLTPLKEYVHYAEPLKERAVAGTIDIGAYEYQEVISALDNTNASFPFNFYKENECLILHLGKEGKREMVVCDLSGRIVLHKNFTTDKITLSLETGLRTVYMVTIVQDGLAWTTKVVTGPLH